MSTEPRYVAVYARYGGRYREAFETVELARQFLEGQENMGELSAIGIEDTATGELLPAGPFAIDD